MLTKRIIPCLDIKNGRTVKGVNFVDLKDAGDPIELAKIYSKSGADELVFLDITATHEKRKTLTDLVKKIAREINIPFTVGGGINSLEIVDEIIKAGADKVAVNSAAIKNPELIKEISSTYGSQCLVLAVDAKFIENKWWVYLNGGRIKTKLDLFSWIKQAEQLGAGEILFTSMDHDGTKNGFAIEALSEMRNNISIPIIASGGAGKMEHFSELFLNTSIDAALAASIFHFNEISIPVLKEFLLKKEIPIRI
ncbi:MAG: imidazole glycerol phosphate synthase subunit HisF [Solirubrobacteraceae bacterium]